MRASLLTQLLMIIWSGYAMAAMAVPPARSPQDVTADLHEVRTAVRSAEVIGNQGLLLKNLRILRDLQTRSDLLDSATLTSLRIVEVNGASDRFTMASDWEALARLSQRAGDFSQAVSAAKRAVLILKTTGDAKRTGDAFLELLDLLFNSERYSEFKHQSEEALRSFKNNGDQAGEAMVLYRQGECLTAQGRVPDALSVLHLALRKRDAIQDHRKTALILFALARANVEVAQWSAASAAMNEALQLAPAAPANSPGLIGLRSRIKEGQGDLKAALMYERQAAYVKDSLFKAMKADRLERIQMIYGVRSKEMVLADLREKDRAMMDSLGAERVKTRMSLLLCAGLTVLLLTVILRRSWLAALARRARIKNRLIEAQAKDLEIKYSELERQSLRLSQALVTEEARKMESIGRPFTEGFETSLVRLLMEIELVHAPDEWTAVAMIRLQSRIRAMALVNENKVKAGDDGKILLKAHLLAVADGLFRERGLLGKMRLELDVAAVDLSVEALMSLCLLFNELLMMTIEHSNANDSAVTIAASITCLGEHRCELLYTDRTGALTTAGLGPGSVSGGMVQVLSKSLNGSIMLLKGEETTFQITFAPQSAMAMRMAS